MAMTRMVGRFCFAVALCASAASYAADPAFPARPIRMIAPSSAGGPVDVVTRIISQAFADTIGQQVVVDNRAGAAGLIGADIVAKATPDGYTLLLGFSGPLVIVPQLNATPAPYDPIKDFAHVSLAATAPYVLLVNPSSPAKSVQELMALAKSQPGRLLYGSGGNGTGIHMAGELFNIIAGTNVVHVPFKGAAPATTALIAGQVNMMFNGLPGAVAHIKAGRVRALAMVSAKRSALMPELPTAIESGLNMEATGWYGVLAPRDTPAPVRAKLNAELNRALATSTLRERLAQQGTETVGSTPAEFTAKIREEWDKWGKVIATAGLKQKS
jgi:tripartite-type tricarboxylate transporter receptor subunit TctC